MYGVLRSVVAATGGACALPHYGDPPSPEGDSAVAAVDEWL
ncbi:hypothetical protein AB0L66_32745 [Streptomyces sp. NPDC052207]